VKDDLRNYLVQKVFVSFFSFAGRCVLICDHFNQSHREKRKLQ